MTTAAAEERRLTHAECMQRLRDQEIGRVVFTEGGLPTALPVNYCLDGDTIVFRTRPGGKLTAAVRGSVVAFEVDRIDTTRRCGWSVVATGVAEEVTADGDLARLEQLNLESWLPDQPSHWVRVTPEIVTGRQVGPAA